MPEVDRHVLSSAAHSGQLLETLQVLAEKRLFAARQARKAGGAVIYPLFVVHFAMLVIPILVVGIGSFEAYLRMVLAMMLPLWAVIIFLIWSVRRRHKWVGLIMRMIPLLRGYFQCRSIADLAFTIRAYLAAGDTVDVAWAGAGHVCETRRLRRLAEKISEKAGLGVAPGQQIETMRGLPEDFVSLYQTGELTGQLDENLSHLWMMYDERASEKLRAASFWYPMLMVVVVAVSVAYVVVTAYVAYLDSILEML